MAETLEPWQVRGSVELSPPLRPNAIDDAGGVIAHIQGDTGLRARNAVICAKDLLDCEHLS